MEKKGYFFILDAFLALTILIVGIFVITSSFITGQKTAQVDFLSVDLLDFMESKKIKDFNDPYAGIGGDLWKQGLITDGESTLLQQIGQFYATGRYDIAESFITNVSSSIIPNQFNYEFWIDGAMIYPQNPTDEHFISRDNTQVLLKSQGITFGEINKSNLNTFGPYNVEVFLWNAGDVTKKSVTSYTICQSAQTKAICDGLDLVYGPGYKAQCCSEHRLCCG